MYYYLANFLLFSIVGSLFEETMKFLFFPKMKSGILTGPFVPVYGFGIVIIILVSTWIFKKWKVKEWKQYFVIFLVITVLLTALEWLGGTLIEFLFHKKMWSYKEIPLHFGPYIALPISLCWGLGGCLFLKFIKSHTDLFIKKIPRTVTYFVFLLFLFDNLYTFFLRDFIHEYIVYRFYFF